MADHNTCDIKLSPNLENTITYVQAILINCSDIIVRRLTIFQTTDAALLYVSVLIYEQPFFLTHRFVP